MQSSKSTKTTSAQLARGKKSKTKQKRRTQRSDKKQRCPVHNFIVKLRSPPTSTSIVGKIKVRHDRKDVEFGQESQQLMNSMVDPLKVYRFRLGGHSTVSMTSGVIDSYVPADPSASGWNSPEWSTLSALFSEFRLVRLTVKILRNFNSNLSTNGVGSLMIGSNLGTAVAPGSYANLADNADATLISYVTMVSQYVHHMHATDLNWSQVTTPTTEPYAGAPGSIQLYAVNNAATGNVADLFHMIIEGIYDFRVRV